MEVDFVIDLAQGKTVANIQSGDFGGYSPTSESIPGGISAKYTHPNLTTQK